MRRNPINFNQFYFANEAHKQNFQKCVQKSTNSTNEYTSTYYLAAYPDIFKFFEFEQQENGTFDWYFDCLDSISLQEHHSTGSTAPLKGQTTALVNLALNLWNGEEFDLASGLSIWDSGLNSIALQAINLRQQGRTIIHE